MRAQHETNLHNVFEDTKHSQQMMLARQGAEGGGPVKLERRRAQLTVAGVCVTMPTRFDCSYVSGKLRYCTL